jgi:hypothetical protein
MKFGSNEPPLATPGIAGDCHARNKANSPQSRKDHNEIRTIFAPDHSGSGELSDLRDFVVNLSFPQTANYRPSAATTATHKGHPDT